MNDRIMNQFVKEGLVVGMVGKQRKYSMEQADIPNIRYWNKFFLVIVRILMKQQNLHPLSHLLVGCRSTSLRTRSDQVLPYLPNMWDLPVHCTLYSEQPTHCLVSQRIWKHKISISYQSNPASF